MKQNVLFLLTAHCGYTKPCSKEDSYDVLFEKLFSSMTQTYIPLLNLLGKIEEKNLPVHIAIVLSPTLCALLNSETVKLHYEDFLSRQIAFGDAEIKRLQNNPLLQKVAQNTRDALEQTRNDFVQVYSRNLLGEFSRHMKTGLLESLGTCATYAFLPHLAYRTELLNAQIEAGLAAHKRYFGSLPEGFWLPYMGYTQGIDEVLKAYSMNYTVLDSQSVLFSLEKAKSGVFFPVRSPCYLAFWARDFVSCNKFSSKQGYRSNPLYKATKRDACYELDANDIQSFVLPGSPRLASGYRYYAQGLPFVPQVVEKIDMPIYDEQKAKEQTKKDAKDFVDFLQNRLNEAQRLTQKDVYTVIPVNQDILGQEWAEGLDWFENVLDLVSSSPSLCLSTFGEALSGSKQASLQKIHAYPCSTCGAGYGEDMLDSTNFFMRRHLFKANQRMIDLADRFSESSGLRLRLLNLAAKEVLLAQSGDWPLMLHDNYLADYAKREFAQNIRAFCNVFESLGSNKVDTEWLVRTEKQHSLFPWLNYKIFGQKK